MQLHFESVQIINYFQLQNLINTKYEVILDFSYSENNQPFLIDKVGEIKKNIQLNQNIIYSIKSHYQGQIMYQTTKSQSQSILLYQIL
ncbi:hypothetical protein pb186bvf_006400 [Paramecium bursaria]